MGYGSTSWKYGEGDKSTVGLHRAVYCRKHGITPRDIKGMVVMHTCDNPRCINAEHLVLGTHQDNMTDMVKKKRSADVSCESNPNRKLTLLKVAQIRNRYKEGDVTFADLGLMYGVGYTAISRIISNKTWSSHE